MALKEQRARLPEEETMARKKQLASQKFSKKKLKTITSPIKVGYLELKNRMWMAPMNETFSGHDGQATEQVLCYFAARAKGGVAVTSTGAVLGTRTAAKYQWSRNLHCFHEGHMQGLVMLTDRIHYFGSLASAQMSIGFGRQGHSHKHDELVPAPTAGLPYEIALDKAPDGVAQIAAKNEVPRMFFTGQQTREMSISEIHSDQKEFAHSCQIAMRSGFDIIEIHAPHGYLEHQFLSPISNKRTDMYGGEWRNRKRFLNEVAEQIRYACPGVVLGVRISNQEYFEGGLTAEEMIDVACDMQARGLDFISLSAGGGYEEGGHLTTDADRAEHLPETAAKFKKALKIPVMIASQHDPVKADKDIADGKFDISALGRALIVDPEYPNKVMAGDLDKLEFCRRDNVCVSRCLAGMGLACSYNPEVGREYGNPDYMIGPRKKHERLMPMAILRQPPPALDRPWWKPEVPVEEKCWRPFRGPGPR
jgi:2,4-dienoyl-CoA reductase-like NADH-dependent reductase (Old Yellow Enzyme family)